jgi:hypothetical protein
MNQDKLNSGDLATLKHINDVRDNLLIFIRELLDRITKHDLSKLESPEREIFAEHLEELGKTQYGSPEYKALLEKVRPAINHHYSKNRHHTEFHKNGIDDMTLVDLVEMLSDWRAATKRNSNGNIRKSIEINAEKYNISPQLRKIMENTVKEYFD